MTVDTKIQYSRMAGRLIDHVANGTTDWAEGTMEVPSTEYTDAEQWQREMDCIFKSLPILVGVTQEIPNPGDFRTLEILGIPLLITRQKDGTAKVLMNVCTHRGMQLTSEPCGNQKLFSCPYHGWNFSNSGELIAISSESDFGKIEKKNYGLKCLPVYKSAGLIWAIMNPDSKVDIPNFLSGYDEMLETFAFSDWIFVSKRTFKGPNWKIAYDGYLEYYHVPVLHRETFGIDGTNRGLYYSWGPHQHIKSPATEQGHIATETLGYLADLIDKDEDEWDTETLTYGVWTVFPSTSIASFDAGGRGVLISQILPGEKVDESITTQYYIMERPPSDPVAAEEQFDFFQRVVMNEDYATGASSQPGLKEGVIDHVLFGRNEQGNQHFHQWVDKVLKANNDKDLNAIFSNGDL